MLTAVTATARKVSPSLTGGCLQRAQVIEPTAEETPESPTTIVHCRTESSLETLGVPEGSWQIFKPPQHKILEHSDEPGIYVVEFNSRHYD